MPTNPAYFFRDQLPSIHNFFCLALYMYTDTVYMYLNKGFVLHPHTVVQSFP